MPLRSPYSAISIKFNTAKRRTHSLFRQGAVAYALIPKMAETCLRPLLEGFDQMLREIPVFAVGRGLGHGEPGADQGRPGVRR